MLGEINKIDHLHYSHYYSEHKTTELDNKTNGWMIKITPQAGALKQFY